MSLKTFHLFFIGVSVLMAIGFGVWEILTYLESGGAGRLVAALLSFVAAVGLILYGVRFVRKQKHLGYL